MGESKNCAENIELWYKGRLIKDSQSLSDYALCDGSVVIMVSGTLLSEYHPLSINYYGRLLTVEIRNTASIAHVKDMISTRIHVSSAHLTFYKDQTEVQDGSSVNSLFSGIENWILNLRSSQHIQVTEGFNITVKTLTGREIPIQIADELNIYQVRCIIAEETGIEVETIRLIYAGRDMCDDMVVGTIRIAPGGTLHMVFRLR